MSPDPLRSRMSAPADAEDLRVIAPPPLLFAAGLALGAALDRALPLAAPPRIPWAGIVLAAAGLGLILWAGATFRAAKTTVLPYGRATFLVPGGPYRFSRNPMYLGMGAIYAGLALATGGVWAYLLLPLVLVTLHRGVIAREERHLEARFGEAYLAYKARVRRWL